MHGFLVRHLPRRAALVLSVLWYALLVAGIVIAYRTRTTGFLYLDL
jgi:hypothetical protein